MKHLIFFILLSSSCFAQLADKTLEGQLNDFVDTAQAAIATKQGEYFLAKNGSYFQGLWTHPDSSLPADGGTSTPNKTVKPSDQTENWTGFGANFASKIPTAVCITFYNSPRGKGYVVRYRLKVGLDIWMRSVNVGPETRYSHDWRKVTPNATFVIN